MSEIRFSFPRELQKEKMILDPNGPWCDYEMTVAPLKVKLEKKSKKLKTLMLRNKKAIKFLGELVDLNIKVGDETLDFVRNLLNGTARIKDLRERGL